MMEFSGPAARHQTVGVKVGEVTVGGGAPVVVQSMTNTDTADAEGTAKQVAALARAGFEIVRINVDRDEGAGAGRCAARAHRGRPRRVGGRGAAHQGKAFEDERRRADRGRLPLYRP